MHRVQWSALDARNLKYNIQPCEKICKTQSDAPPPPRALCKGGYYTKGGGLHANV